MSDSLTLTKEKTMKTAALILCTVGAVAVYATTPSHAAQITWGPIQTISANTDIINPSGVIEAWNFGDAGANIDVDVSGTTITFAPRTLPFAGTDTNNAFFNANGTSVDSNFESVLDSFAFNNPPNDPNPKTLSFTNLTDGGQFALQLFTSDDRPRTWNFDAEIDGESTVLFTGAGNSASSFATAMVDLDPGETSFDLVLNGLSTGPGGDSSNGLQLVVLNAAILSEFDSVTNVPEPSSLVSWTCVLLCGLLFGLWRKLKRPL